MGRHDEDLVDAKAQDQMDEHIEAEAGETEPEKTTSASAPDTDDEEQHHQCFYPITPRPVVRHEHRAMDQCVFQEMLLMELH